MVSTLFLDKEAQKLVVGNYVRKFYNADNSMYAMLMLFTDQAHLIFGSDQEDKLVENWKV